MKHRASIALNILLFTSAIIAQTSDIVVGSRAQAERRTTQAAAGPVPRVGQPVGSMSPQERRQAVDAFWGPGRPTEEKLQIFDKYWNYVDQKFSAFHHIDIDWPAMRDRYRPEVAAGVSRGRFAAIMNQMAIALRESHSIAVDMDVNYTVPVAGVPMFAIGDWTYNQSGACSTAQPDGSALIYSVRPNHPLGLQRGDRVLGYDGRPWRALYQQLLEEELPFWPLYWGSSPNSFRHTLDSSVTMNWHLFETMDIAKLNGDVVHVPTSLMPGAIWSGFCSEQMPIFGIPKPVDAWEDGVRHGVLAGTQIGYVYVFGWGPTSDVDFADALYDLTQVRQVEGLIIDFRYNMGGYMVAPHSGISVLFPHPMPTTGVDERRDPSDHFTMRNLISPSTFILDFRSRTSTRGLLSFDGPIALLTGPGAVSSGDFSSLWMSYHPNVRSFGKSSASAFNLPTQPALGTELDLGPEWWAAIAEADFYKVGAPHSYLTGTELHVDEPVWLRPEDVAVGRDTVVVAAYNWIDTQITP